MATIEIGMEKFETLIATEDIVFIDFWADWCGPCKAFGPVFEKVSEDYPDIKFAKCDTQKEEQLAGMFGIKSIPTLAVFKENILIFNQAGSLPEESLRDLVEKVIELDMAEVRKEIAENEAGQ